MNFLTRMAGSLGVKVRKGYTGYVDTDFFVRALTLGEALSGMRGHADLHDAYKNQITVYSAITACAMNLSQVPFRFYQGDDLQAGLQKTSVYDELFEAPNPLMSKFQLWEATEIFMKLRGECLWVLEFNGGKPNGTVPIEIYPQDPLRFQPIIDKEAKMIAAWVYRQDDGTPLYFEHGTEILQFKKYNPYDRYRGLSPLSAAALSMSMGNAARAYNESILMNNGEPGGVLETENPLTKDQADDIRNAFETRHQGPNRAKRLAVLHSGLKYKQVALAQKDMEFLATINLSVEDILGALRVPKTEVFKYDDVRKETAEVQDRALWTKNLLPEMRYLEDTLWAQFFRLRADRKTYGRFDESQIAALQDNLETKARTAQAYFAMGWPLNKINEHFALGMDDVPWGDMGYLPANLVPADMLNEPKQVPPPLAPLPALPPPDKNGKSIFDEWIDRTSVLLKGNPNHAPAGSSEGGQFISGDGGTAVGGDLGTWDSESPAVSAENAKHGNTWLNVRMDEAEERFEEDVLSARVTFQERFAADNRVTEEQAGRALTDLYGDEPLEHNDGAKKNLADRARQIWTTTSGDSKVDAVAIQIAVQREFNLKGTSLSHVSGMILGPATEMANKHAVTLQGLARAMYENTQEYFAYQGISSISLARGLKVPDPEGLPNRLTITGQPLASYSSDFRWASSFGAKNVGTKMIGMTIVERVPVTSIFSIGINGGFGTINEKEVVVLGGPRTVSVVYRSQYESEKSYDMAIRKLR